MVTAWVFKKPWDGKRCFLLRKLGKKGDKQLISKKIGGCSSNLAKYLVIGFWVTSKWRMLRSFLGMISPFIRGLTDVANWCSARARWGCHPTNSIKSRLGRTCTTSQGVLHLMCSRHLSFSCQMYTDETERCHMGDSFSVGMWFVHTHGFHCLERWQHPHNAWLCLNCFGEGIAEELFRTLQKHSKFGVQFTSWVCLSCSNILTMVYPFSHNHGSGQLPQMKGNYYWTDLFFTSMIMEGRVYTLTLKVKMICLNEKLAEFFSSNFGTHQGKSCWSHDLSYFREGMKENEATSQGSATPKLPSINRF